MGLLDKIFGKKTPGESAAGSKQTDTVQLQAGDEFISSGDHVAYKILRPLTDTQKESIEKSTILLRGGQLYMHYWTKGLICPDRNDQEWQNKVMYFWKAEEPFPKKSLPPNFETFEAKHFLFQGDLSKISVQVGQAMPWFGMPGLGEKHLCQIDGENVTVPELNNLGIVEYVAPVELTEDNLSVLTDRENYYFLVDERITPFHNGNFYLNNQVIPINMAYAIGGIHLVRKTGLE